MDLARGFKTPVTRWYVDVRSLAPPEQSVAESRTVRLPLIEHLPDTTQHKVRKFMRAQDKLMSLASALLKVSFIHRTAKVPWKDVHISSTPKPHSRPYWNPPAAWRGEEGLHGLEFNVTHQAGIIALVGCRLPSRPRAYGAVAVPESIHADPQTTGEEEVRVGVDIACTHEHRRTPDLSSHEKLVQWIDTFAEMFSERERNAMKEDEVPTGVSAAPNGPATNQKDILDQKARRFYTYWALKEAYIKMVGEGLLADWLRKLEFIDVVAPKPGQRVTPDEVGMKILFDGRDISKSLHVELEGLQGTYLLATAIRGIDEIGSATHWVQIDMEEDIRPCAEGTCSCLEG